MYCTLDNSSVTPDISNDKWQGDNIDNYSNVVVVDMLEVLKYDPRLPRLPWYENFSKYGISPTLSAASLSCSGGVSCTGSFENSSGMYLVSQSDFISGFQGGVNCTYEN